MAGVFISYRRRDSEPYADALYSEIARRLDTRDVFLDTRGIAHGADFTKEIRERLTASKIVLVLIGPDWLDARDANGVQRLSDDEDWVRTEIREAFTLGCRVIPVLVRGAAMPPRQALPSDIAPLADLNAFVFVDFVRDVPRLVDLIDRRLPVAEPAVVMALAAVGGAMVRTSLQTSARGSAGLNPADFFPIGFYAVLGTGLYYGTLVLGASIATRRRLGWRMEEMLRVAGCVVGGAGLGHMAHWAVFGVTAVDTVGYALRTGLWFLGIGAGLAIGLRRFAPNFHWPPFALALSVLVLAVLAAAGAAIEFRSEELNGAIENVLGLQGAIRRSWLWLPITLGLGAIWAARSHTRGRRLVAFARLTLPLVATMILADLVASAAGQGVPRELLGAKNAWDNALFYGATMATLVWRINVYERLAAPD